MLNLNIRRTPEAEQPDIEFRGVVLSRALVLMANAVAATSLEVGDQRVSNLSATQEYISEDLARRAIGVIGVSDANN